MKKTREEIQNGYWNGGEIKGYQFHPLNVSRTALVQEVWNGMDETTSKLTGAQLLVAMAIYNMVDLDVENAEPDFAKLRARAAERGLGRISMAGCDEFQRGFLRDIAAMEASSTRLAGEPR